MAVEVRGVAEPLPAHARTLTVGQLIDGFDVHVLAGASGLGRRVAWVHISEVPDPTPWLSGGELLLTTGMKLEGPGGDYVARLAEHGLAGLGVGLGTGAGLDAVPEGMAAEADRHEFPLFTVPRELPFIALTKKAAAHIVNVEYALLQRATAAQERLERVVLDEGGLQGIAATLAGLVGGTAVIASGAGRRPLAAAGPQVDTVASALDQPSAGGDGALVLAVRDDVRLAACRSGGPLTDVDRLILRQAVTTVALELLRRRVAMDTERRLAGDVLASMLSGRLEGPELRRRLAPFGLGETVAAVVVPRGEGVEHGLAAVLRGAGVAGFVAPAGALVCAMVAPPADEPGLLALAERLRAAAGGRGSVGRPVPAADAKRTFQEARWALEARALSGDGDGALATYRDLGSFQLLLALQDDDALQLFCDSMLAPIEDGEGAYGGELMRSLEAFIECNGQWEKAARRLFCHRHTLRYRIRRVEDLTGRSLESARDRIDFWLALRARELMHPPTTRNQPSSDKGATRP